jgi:hypothetical protein
MGECLTSSLEEEDIDDDVTYEESIDHTHGEQRLPRESVIAARKRVTP